MGEVRDGPLHGHARMRNSLDRVVVCAGFFCLPEEMVRRYLQNWKWLELPFLQLRCWPQSVVGPLFYSPSEYLTSFYISTYINAEVSQISSLGSIGSCIHPLASHLHQDIPQSPQTQPTLPELFAFPSTYTFHLDSPISVNTRGLPSTYLLKLKPCPIYPHILSVTKSGW